MKPGAPWILLTESAQLDSIQSQSYITPVILFKHSTICSISSLAFKRLSSKPVEITSSFHNIPCYFLDLFQYRSLSDRIARDYHVYHESPQILIIRDGECIFESSHLDITLSEIEEQLMYSSKG